MKKVTLSCLVLMAVLSFIEYDVSLKSLHKDPLMVY